MQKQSTKISEKNIKILVPGTCNKGVPFAEAFRLAKENKAIIISNKMADEILVDPYLYDRYRNVFPISTGTFVAYQEPDKILGSVIEYEDHESGKTWTLEIPMAYRALKNSILVAEHPNYSMVEKKNRVIVNVSKNKLIVIENFPKKDGWYRVDKTTSIPINVPSNSHVNLARYLYRIKAGVGPLVRKYNYYFDGRRIVDATLWPSVSYGVLATTKAGREAVLREGMQRTIKSLSDQVKELPKTGNKEGIKDNFKGLSDQIKELSETSSKIALL